MEALQNTTLWLVLLSSACLFAVWQWWRYGHPRCGCCRKHIRRAFAYCPWCAMQQFHPRRVQQVRPRRTARQQARGDLLTQEATMLPHKRPRTVVLPERGRHQGQQGQRAETVLVHVPYEPSHVLICANCHTVLDEEDVRCWYCNGTTFTWQEKRR